VLEKSSGSIQRRQRSRIEHHGTRTPETALFDSYPDVHTSSFAVIFLMGTLSKEGRSLGCENEKGTLRLAPIPIPENMHIFWRPTRGGANANLLVWRPTWGGANAILRIW
jgi:hypothetical protein